MGKPLAFTLSTGWHRNVSHSVTHKCVHTNIFRLQLTIMIYYMVKAGLMA